MAHRAAFTVKGDVEGHSLPRGLPRRGLERFVAAMFLSKEIWAVYASGLLCGRASLGSHVFPFGLALFWTIVRSGRRTHAVAAVIAILAGMATASPTHRVLSLGIVLFAGLFVHHTEAEGNERTGLWRQAVSITSLHVAVRLVVNGVFAIYESIVWVCLEAVLIVATIVLWHPLTRLWRSREQPDAKFETWVAVALYMVVISLGLGGIGVGPLQLMELFNRLLTFVAALAGGAAIGAAAGTALGWLTGLGAAVPLGGEGAYALAGMLGGLFASRGKFAVGVGFLFGHVLVSLTPAVQADVLSSLLHALAALALFTLVPNEWMKAFAYTLPGSRTRESLVVRREQRLREAVSDALKRASRLAIGMSRTIAAMDRSGPGGVDPTAAALPLQLREIEFFLETVAAQVRVETGKAEELQFRLTDLLRAKGCRADRIEVRPFGTEQWFAISIERSLPFDRINLWRKQVEDAVQAVCGKSYTLLKADGTDSVYRACFAPEPPYAVEHASIVRARDRSGISGDVLSRIDLIDGRVAVVLSDGMGVGPQAAVQSGAAVQLFSMLLETGFDLQSAVRSVNSLLLVHTGGERSATFDAVIIDRYTGTVEFLKVGSVPAFIKRRSDIEIVRSSSVPLGMIRHIDVRVQQRQLDLGDTVVLMTDGVLDSIIGSKDQVEWMAHVVRRSENSDPRELLDRIVHYVDETNGGAWRDDATLVSIRLIQNRPAVLSKGIHSERLFHTG